MQGKVEELLKLKPYALSVDEKKDLFLQAMQATLKHHYDNCPEFRKYCMNKKFEPGSLNSLKDVPFLPVSIFKKVNLISVPRDEIVRTVRSSSTTGSQPSVINLDRMTANRQMLALNYIMTDVLGSDKLDFLIVDSEKTITANDDAISSRGSAIRGLLSLARKFNFVLDDKLALDSGLLDKSVGTTDRNKCCVFGFTWLIYQTVMANSLSDEIRKTLSSLENTVVLHIGGWKKLKDINVEKREFNERVAKFFNTKSERVIDLYGMTEQLGTVYPDCPFGYKHVPAYSEILVRDVHDQQVLPAGRPGFLQLLSPIPNSYPGASILSDDIGEIIGEDDCPCGRKGKYFVFRKRSEVAEPKGCGDTLAI